MPITNVISIEFTAAELKQLDDAIATLETIFKTKAVQLTPAESQQYGKLGNKTENWSNMVYNDSKTAPSVIPSFVDQKEWAKDEAARDQLSSRATRLESITQQISDTNRVIGFDIYQTRLSVYQNCKFLSAQDMPGAKALYEKWSTPFSGRRHKALKADNLTNTEMN